MAVNPEALPSGGPAAPARRRPVSAARTGRRIALDRWASRLVVVGGLVIIASILAIVFVLVAEVWPLFRAPEVELIGPPAAGLAAGAGGPVGSIGTDEYREVAFQVTREGALQVVDLKWGTPVRSQPIPGLEGASVSRVVQEHVGSSRYLIGTSDGRVIPLDMKFDVTFREGTRGVAAAASFGEAVVLDPERKRPIVRLAAASADSGAVLVAQLGPRELVVHTVTQKKALVGEGTREESLQALALPAEGDVTALNIDERGADLFLGTSQGRLVRVDLGDKAAPRVVETVDISGTTGAAPVTVVDFLLGDRTIVVGDEAGRVTTWQIVRPEAGGDPRLVRVHEFRKHAAPVMAVSASPRDKGFVTADTSGQVEIHYGTSGRTLMSFTAPAGDLRAVFFAPKADAVVTADTAGQISQWKLTNPHPEITLGTLFGKVWYEGYSAPAYVWQSTGGSDDFEAKLSLTPLVYGTLKGTFYALVVAVPLALFAALYVSEFMHPDLKAYVKPVVEIMAALPSVVLGFLAGLWLAPIVERVVPGLFLVPLVVPALILAAFFAWRLLPVTLRRRLRPGTEVALLIPVVVAGVWIALSLGGLVEMALLGGNYRGWLLSTLGLTYDQRNSLVVGVAMGFAVIPIIFTIAEDSLANVPGHLRAGSLALGANRWQTALRIVLPTASPGIFSAVMIGFGRAVGETMIVLMATGNTPVMDWSIFNGFRALSANIAVELPEAPEQGTLFRVLFLAALLLFCLTFALNTVAELVRLRLRQRYRYL
ncbi:MAG TPA: ABC transporter permease subunit [Candidatus Binatia bacterium]|nr:ABC transporter permease subunit [Candidatus Binatia bacterium]